MKRQLERDKIMTKGGVKWNDSHQAQRGAPIYGGGIAFFENLGVDTLKHLVQKGYVVPEEAVPEEDPALLDIIIRVMEQHPGLTCEGYVVVEDRPDFRLTITGLTYEGKVSPTMLKAFDTMFPNADVTAKRLPGDGAKRLKVRFR